MPSLLPRYRFLWRLRAPAGADEIRRVERWLATARVFLAGSSLVAIQLDPGEIGYSIWAYGLLAFYIAQGVVIIILLRRRQESTASFRRLVHSADVIWPAMISLFTAGQRSPFFLFFVFVLAAAAYRWGLRETLGTASAAVLLLWGESFLVRHGFVFSADRVLVHHGLPPLGVNVSEFEPERLFMLSVYLLVMGLLLGYLAQQQKQLRAEKAVIARIQGYARVEAGLSATLQEILGELCSMYGARRILIASQETASPRVFLAEVRLVETSSRVLRWLEYSPSHREIYLYECPADACYTFRKGDSFAALGLDHDGMRLRNFSATFATRLAELHDFRSVATVSFIFGQDWWGRVFLFDPVLMGDRQEELRFLQEVVRQVGPAVYNVYLLRRLRKRAGAVERARVARELHDGAVQSLIAMEMQVDVLRRKSALNPAPLTEDLSRIQGLLRDEVLKLRELMQQMKSLDVDAKRLLGFLSDTVERFQRETGITARFVSEVEEVEMPQRVCRELARIVQEGLVNVRKHSGAQQVLVRLSSQNGAWKLTVEDDGRGFAFSGRLSQAELDAQGKGPLVIKERVRLIAGELTIESNPGQGSRLEISVPQNREAAYG